MIRVKMDAEEMMRAYLTYSNLSEYYEYINRKGLTAKTLRYFLLIGAYERRFQINPTLLGKFTGKSISTVSQNMQRMEKQGLVERIRADGDGRVTILKLSSRGREVYERLIHKWAKEFEDEERENILFCP